LISRWQCKKSVDVLTTLAVAIMEIMLLSANLPDINAASDFFANEPLQAQRIQRREKKIF
jgi:hypothetical protein